jgi:fructose-specific phosphotransferase system IIC component
MWGHTIAIAVVNLKRMQNGTFHYNFSVYSLFLFGIVFIVLSGFTIHAVKKYLRGELNERRNIFILNLLTTLFFLPVGFINPIGFLPVLASIFSSILLLSDGRYRKKVHTRSSANETELVPENQYAYSA